MSPLLLVLVVQAQVYSWTDKAGVEHYTDALTSIPRGVKVRTTEGDEISRIDSDPKKLVARPAVKSEPAAPSTSEETWRRLFREARTRVTVLEEEIEADRKKVEEVNGLPVTARFNCQTNFFVPAQQLVMVNGATISAGGQVVPGVVVNGSVTGTTVVRQNPTFFAPCGFGFNPEYERIRERLEKNRRELPRAKEELADLERRASFEAVPLHWRR